MVTKLQSDVKVRDYNNQLREELKKQIANGTVTMAEFERKTEMGHTFLFLWFRGDADISRLNLFWRVVKGLGIKVTL